MILPPEDRLIALFVVVIVAVQLSLPDQVSPGPLWLVPVIEVLSIVALVIQSRRDRSRREIHVAAVAVALAFVLATVMNAVLLLVTLFEPTSETGPQLLIAGMQVLAINVASFAVIYWRLDGGGPFTRRRGQAHDPDFQFPQQASGDPDGWRPGPVDYLFVAYTNIVAFSPTDTMPLRWRTKLLFMLQSSVSLVTIVVTLSRAINMIPSS